jgi:hypothetical protein
MMPHALPLKQQAEGRHSTKIIMPFWGLQASSGRSAQKTNII